MGWVMVWLPTSPTTLSRRVCQDCAMVRISWRSSSGRVSGVSRMRESEPRARLVAKALAVWETACWTMRMSLAACCR